MRAKRDTFEKLKAMHAHRRGVGSETLIAPTDRIEGSAYHPQHIYMGTPSQIRTRHAATAAVKKEGGVKVEGEDRRVSSSAASASSASSAASTSSTTSDDKKKEARVDIKGDKGNGPKPAPGHLKMLFRIADDVVDDVDADAPLAKANARAKAKSNTTMTARTTTTMAKRRWRRRRRTAAWWYAGSHNLSDAAWGHLHYEGGGNSVKPKAPCPLVLLYGNVELGVVQATPDAAEARRWATVLPHALSARFEGGD